MATKSSNSQWRQRVSLKNARGGGDNNNNDDAAVGDDLPAENNVETAADDPVDGAAQQEDDTAPPVVSSPEATDTPVNKEHPQDRVDKFWLNFKPDFEGGVTRILPDTVTGTSASKVSKDAQETSVKAIHSYESARASCIKGVKRIVRECQSRNQKYTDPHFDLEEDLKVTRDRDCLYGLAFYDGSKNPQDVKRVTDIFDSPQFFKDGAGFDDIVQGALGDCWLLAGLSALAANEDLLRKVCVVQEEEIGVYGFVFHRDGYWYECIIDDKLYLSAPSFDESTDTILERYGVRQKNQEKLYTDTLQRGSKALYFASCRDENETWVPLIEKALAKFHGDYSALDGGQVGEGLEDLTGGVTTEIYTASILSKDRFWKDLRRIGQDFLFSCNSAGFSAWRDVDDDVDASIRKERRKDIIESHAYSVLDTYEGHGQRLVKIRNPWGDSEWTGAWSDGAKEWTVEWLERLGHQFGDDGVFWMTYEDMINKYKNMDRTRVFKDEWHIAQEWCGVQVPFASLGYQETKFSIDVPDDTEAVVVLSQLDTRYFLGLQGQYDFKMSFRIQKDGEEEDDYISRSATNYSLRRSTNVEVFLEKGKYTVLFKVEAYKNGMDDVETVLRENIYRREKVMQTSLLYDLAYKKGLPPKKEEKSKEQGDAKGEEVKKVEVVKTDKEPQKEASGTEPPKTSDPSTVTDPEGPETKAEGDKPADNEAPTATTDVDKPTNEPSTPAAPATNDTDPNRDPWNAYCVLGLRVYSFLPELGLKVIRPGDDKEAGENSGVVLDRDDVAKPALAEVEEKVEESA